MKEDKKRTKREKLKRSFDKMKDETTVDSKVLIINGKSENNSLNKKSFSDDRKTHDNLSSKFEKGIKSLADVKHKNCTGANNWQRFKNNKEPVNKQKVNNNVNNNKSKQPVGGQNNKNRGKMKLTNVVAMDCEMVGTGIDGKESVLARVSLVNIYGDCLYDKFVKPRETVTDYRTHVSGVREIDLKYADSFETVQKEVAALIRGRILVGHGLKNDLEVLFLSHPRRDIRDTSKFFRRRGKGTPSLKNLALEYLDTKIQEGEHSSVQDARAAVQLYSMYRNKWESAGGNRRNVRIDSQCDQTRYYHQPRRQPPLLTMESVPLQMPQETITYDFTIIDTILINPNYFYLLFMFCTFLYLLTRYKLLLVLCVILALRKTANNVYRR